MQPTAHQAPLVRLLSASVGLPAGTELSRAAQAVQSAGLLDFHPASQHELVLRFQARYDVSLDLRATLGLILQGSNAA
jgi:hypothetical protein